jgi:hypothetical protein
MLGSQGIQFGQSFFEISLIDELRGTLGGWCGLRR